MYEDIFSAFAGCSDPVVAPGEFVFSAVGLDHGHIYGMADGLLRAGRDAQMGLRPGPAEGARLLRQVPAGPARRLRGAGPFRRGDAA